MLGLEDDRKVFERYCNIRSAELKPTSNPRDHPITVILTCRDSRLAV